jgi:hypothetical protein
MEFSKSYIDPRLGLDRRNVLDTNFVRIFATICAIPRQRPFFLKSPHDTPKITHVLLLALCRYGARNGGRNGWTEFDEHGDGDFAISEVNSCCFRSGGILGKGDYQRPDAASLLTRAYAVPLNFFGSVNE